MRALGHERFAVVGHDRGSYYALRKTLDHPGHVTCAALLDCLPISEHLDRTDARFATAWWHWFFFAQPMLPERVIIANPDAWYRGDPEEMGPENYAERRAAVHDPARAPCPDSPEASPGSARELLLGFFQAENERDWDTYGACLALDVEWVCYGAPERSAVRGREAYLAAMQRAYTGYSTASPTPTNSLPGCTPRTAAPPRRFGAPHRPSSRKRNGLRHLPGTERRLEQATADRPTRDPLAVIRKDRRVHSKAGQAITASRSACGTGLDGKALPPAYSNNSASRRTWIQVEADHVVDLLQRTAGPWRA